MIQNIINQEILQYLYLGGKMEKIGIIVSTVLYALALAIGVLGAIFYYLEMEFFATETALLMLFIAVFFVALAGLNQVDRD